MPARKRFPFTPELTTELLEFLQEYKTVNDFANVDFNSDKTRQYEHLRKKMASKHESTFGLVELTTSPNQRKRNRKAGNPKRISTYPRASEEITPTIQRSGQ